MLEKIAFGVGAIVVASTCVVLLISKMDAKFVQQVPEVRTAEITNIKPQIIVEPAATVIPKKSDVTEQPAATDKWALIRANVGQAAASAPLTKRYSVVPDNYYSQWSDLIAKCWASVSNNMPFDDTGLVAVGTERLSDTGYSRQKWRTADRIYTVTYTHESSSRAGTGIDRTCSIKTWRQPFSAETVQALKDHYDDWFARERLEAASVFKPYRWTLREGDQYHAANTTFGSAQGCRMYMSYRDIVFGSDTEAQFFLTELTDEDCDAPNGASATAGVRVNRLPQITD